MLINILIATIDAGIENVPAILLDPTPDLKYIVSHQVTAGAYRAIPEELKREDVIVSQIEGRGLSRNRNNALSLSDGDIALLADDDLHYRPEYFQEVKDAFLADQELALACFKIATPAGEPEYKDYAAEPYLLNRESHHYISSLEIVFRVEPIKACGIWFDERFGIGSELVQSGEEAVFIFDCIRAGLKVKYIPAYVVEHPEASRTKQINEYATERTVFKGAYDARRYGWRALPAAFYDSLRLYAVLREQGKDPARYLHERLRGARYILRTENRRRCYRH
ncbi:MAG: glycosyltransferase family A protein [Dethiobacteria bacterium]|nr:glycosyltransferase family A protein [Dethiobacteria bacterium]